ncbi:MAG TPA: thioredoxin-dependent thiol peroxidase [Hellea balneolensis]|uniref:thioredoxin-dependent peroxiredoxin n=1 Tax=Hellea balneolensis TaxID=287478 RepID=A0A7C5R844_9PROT|nr:thioredoxin-dependent thiol peroxidase [Hellea balneolensis]
MTHKLEPGDMAPAFTLPTNGGGEYSIPDSDARMVVLYFYPKDSTPGCTTEAIDFSTLKHKFDKLGVKIVGVSKDSVKRHDNFVAKQNLTITLASDEQGDILDKYGVWVEKKNYGRVYMGIERSTFLIGADGKIAHIWRKVRVKNHAQDVLDMVKTLLS